MIEQVLIILGYVSVGTAISVFLHRAFYVDIDSPVSMFICGFWPVGVAVVVIFCVIVWPAEVVNWLFDKWEERKQNG